MEKLKFMATTETLDQLIEALQGRNKEKDNELTKFWIKFIKNRLEELDENIHI